MSVAPRRQLALDLGHDPSFGCDDFLVAASNESAVAAVRQWPDWPGRTLLLIGPPGSGKSHLAAIWATERHATTVEGGEALRVSLWGREGSCVVLEDFDRGGIAEHDLFHALNAVNETEGWLLMTARTFPATWGVKTPDLLSRLRLAWNVALMPPDAELMKSVLVKLFADRQIAVDEDVVNYAARHCDQSLGAVNVFVEAMDRIALAEGRKITRPLAREILELLNEDRTDRPSAAAAYGPT